MTACGVTGAGAGTVPLLLADGRALGCCDNGAEPPVRCAAVPADAAEEVAAEGATATFLTAEPDAKLRWPEDEAGEPLPGRGTRSAADRDRPVAPPCGEAGSAQVPPAAAINRLSGEGPRALAASRGSGVGRADRSASEPREEQEAKDGG